MGQSSEVEAGRASVRVGADDSPYNATLDRAEKRLKNFGAAAMAIGAKLSGLGVGLGVGLISTVKSFASTGKELDTVNQKMAKLDQTSEEFMKLRKEAERLNKILGGENAQAAMKLNESFGGLRDSISGVVVKLGAVLAPALTSVVGYMTKAVDKVTAFIGRNRALAPQATIVAAALVAAGVATGLLGAAFYVTGPIIRLAMIGATVATLAFGVTVGVVNTTVAIANATLKILTATVTLGVAAIRALHLGTVLYTVAAAACSVASRILAATFGVLLAVTKMVTLATLAMGSAWLFAKVGMVGLAGAVRTAYGLYRMLTIAQIGLAVSSAIVSVGLAGIGIAIVAGIAAFFMYSDAGRQAGEQIAGVFTRTKDMVLSAFGGINMEGAKMPSMFSGYFSDVASMASTAWNGILSTAKSVFASASELFLDLLGTAKQTFAGVSDAIEAGNIQLAMDTLWAGLKVAWTQGTDAFRSAWGTSLIYIEGALDICVTSLKMIWDVGLAYMAGAFDTFTLGVRNKMQDISNSWAEWIANTGVFGEVDAESIQEENKARSEQLNSGAKERADARNKQIAEAGDDAGAKEREAKRIERLNQLGGASPELAALKQQLLDLQGQAAREAADARAKAKEAGQPGANAAAGIGVTMNSAAAQARNSAGAAGAIARFANASSLSPAQQQLAEAKLTTKEQKQTNKLLAQIAKQPAVKVNQVT